MPFFTCKPRWWLFNLAHRLPPERFCEVDKHSGGQVLQQVFLLKSWMGGAGVWCSLCEEMTSSILLLHSELLACCSGKAWRLTHCGSTFAVVSAGAQRQCVSCLRLRLVEYGYEAFTSTIFCFGSGLLKSKLSSLLKSLGRGSNFSWKNEEGTHSGLAVIHCGHHWLNEPNESDPCLGKEEKAIPLFKTNNLNASGVVVMVHRFEVMYRIQVSSVIRRSGYDKIWAELYTWTQETNSIFLWYSLKKEKNSCFVNFKVNKSLESCSSYLMRIKGERMICKVSREQTLKTEFFKDCGWFGAGGWTTCSRLTVRHVQCPRRADENLPKWSWSPLSRSSPWSWSQASVSCDVGVHQANCGRPCRTLEKARRTNS